MACPLKIENRQLGRRRGHFWYWKTVNFSDKRSFFLYCMRTESSRAEYVYRDGPYLAAV